MSADVLDRVVKEKKVLQIDMYVITHTHSSTAWVDPSLRYEYLQIGWKSNFLIPSP